MLSLIKIRAKYLSRHKCGVYCSYLFIPTLIFITIMFILMLRIDKSSRHYPHKFEGVALQTSIDFFNQDLKQIEDTFAFLTEDKNDCKIISQILSTSITCGTKESDVENKNKTIIKIINDDEKYDIKLQLNESSGVFDNNLISTENFIDLFISPDYYKSRLNLDYYEHYGYNENYNKFLQLQSLMSKFLIKKKGQDYENKHFLLNVGANSYPPNYRSYTSSLIGIVTGLTIVMCLQFSMTTYFFSIRMIDEKEKKLTILLERQGVSKKQYFLSWMFSFLMLSIIPALAYILFYVFFIDIHIFLFFINVFLFVCSLFSFSYFFYTCISTTKTASIIIKFINFTSAVLGSPIAFPQCSKPAKVLFAFIPQINVYLCSTSIDKLSDLPHITWESLWLKAYKFSYMESIIMYIVDIIFYSLLSLFIEKYKSSGLTFFEFMKSFFVKVSRDVNYKNNERNYIEINENNENNNNIIEFPRNFQELSPFNKSRKEKNECLKLVNICKNFDTLKAVDNFNGELFGNEIFCLLGHNGAGKTTLINMISGIYDPSHGDIFYNGRSIVTDKQFLFFFI